MQGDVVETSDAEEEEEMRASEYVYWKKEAKYETSDRNDDLSPKKRLKLEHTYETVSETPSRNSPSPHPSLLPPSSQPLEPASSPPFILPTSTLKSSPSVSTSPPPQSASDVWDKNRDFYDDSSFPENSQDPLLLTSQKSPRISKLEPEMLEFPPSPVTSLYSNESELRSRRSLVSSVYGTPVSSPAPIRSQSHVPTRSQSVNPLSLFNTPPPHPPPELLDTVVSSIPNDVKILLSPVQRPLSPHLPLSSPLPAPYLLRSPSQPPTYYISLSPLTLPSPHAHVNDYDPLFDSPPSNTLPVLASPVKKDHESAIAPLSELEVANIPDQPRYSLRRRGANQLKPYTIEKLQYKKALSSNPDAIVKFRSPTRGGRGHRHDNNIGESQEQWEPYAADEDEPWKESQWPHSTENAQAGPSRLPASDIPDEPPVQYSEFLQDLPTTDEEEANELKALSKEVRKAVRERRAREAREMREAKEKLNRKKPKSFPLLKGHIVTDKSRPRTRNSHFDAGGSATNPEFPRHSASKEKEPNRPLTPVFISSTPPDLFADPSNDFHPLSPMELSDHEGGPSEESFKVSHNIPMDGIEPLSDIGEDDINGGRPQSPGNEVGDGGGLDLPDNPLDRKRMKVLGRMVPAFMLKHLAKDSNSSKPAHKRQRSVTVISGSDDDGAEELELQPGKTRARWVKHLKDDIEIKGDKESSDDERSSLSDSESEDPRGGFYPNSHTPQRLMEAEVIDISDSSEESHNSSDEGVDDETIQAYLDGKITNRKPRRVGQRKEESLIDWMLSRAQTVGGPSKANVKKQSSSNNPRRKASSQMKYKMDVITNHGKRMRRERQSKLNFGHPTRDTGKRPPSKRDGDFRPASIGPRRPEVGAEDDFDHSRDEVLIPLVSGILKNKTRKEKAKERRARAKANGVYTFGSNDTQVVTGLRARGMVTIDIEEDDFNAGPAWYCALTPPNQTPPNPPSDTKKVPTSRQSRAGKENVLDDHVQGTNGIKTKPRRRRIKRPGDFGIPLLHSGLSFTITTFIGRGWLRELCEVISPTGTPPMPTVTLLRGIEIGPSMSLEKFTKSLGEVLDGLFNFATGLPAFDSTDEAKEWAILSRVCCQLLSWWLSTGGENDRSYLRNVVSEQVLKLVPQVRGLCLEASTLDLSTFSLCWLLVELSVRLGQTIQRQSSNSLSEAIALLVQHLLESDIEKTMAPVCDGSPLDSSTTAGYTAELWVCLFHILDTHNRMAPDTKQPHPFWLVLQKGLESVSLSMNLNPFETSEAIWGAIFSLCALTQFSVHGMTMARSRLPAYWELVVVALKKVPLNASLMLDNTRPNSLLNKRDRYANLAVRRCVDLSHRWEWSLEQSSTLFNQLAEIFRSRKFANLRHETPDYPPFMHDNRWDLHLDYRRGDSAFVLFLRLLVKAAEYDPTNPTRTPSPRAKKLLSLAIPVGSLAFSKSHPTAIRDLSMLSVRLAAIAVGIHVDPTSHASRITHARTYVNFSDADDTTRKAVIRGIQYLAALMTTWRVPLDAIADWIRVIAGELADELKNILKTPNNLTKRNGVSFTVSLLVGCVRHIFEAHQACSEYPEPALLNSLRIFFISSLSTEAQTLDELRLLIETMLDARAAVMPPPEQPRLASVPILESQESQDDYGDFDLDFDDPALLAALGDVQVPAVEQPDYKTKEEKMRQAIKATQFHYLAWRKFNAFVKDPQEHKRDHEYFGIVDSWIYCWVGATLMAADGGSERASGKIFKLWDPFRETLQRDIVDQRQRRVDLTIMLCLLKLDPMSYLEIQDRYIKMLMNCLIAMEVDLDSEYVGLLFSIDGLRHPLLVGAPCERESEAVDFKIPPQAFEVVSLEILQTILLNLATLCNDVCSDRDKYLDFVKGMLSTMRRLSMDERWKSRPAYVERCRRVIQMVSEHLGNRLPALAFFMDWERTLE